MPARSILRRQFLSLSAIPLFAQARKRPNIIHILADDLGWGDLGCYGNSQIRSPNLDKLASQGTLFTQFYSANPVCSPSRTAWLTGHFPARHGIHAHLATDAQNAERGMPNWLDPNVVTLPRLLKEQGYTTAHFGKWHLGSGAQAPTPDAYGFDRQRAVNSRNQAWKEANEDKYFRAKSTRIFVDEIGEFLDKNAARPFYINLWTLLPHAPLNPTEDQMEPYKKRGPGAATGLRGASEIYFGSVTELDTQIGRLMKKLDDLKLADNTIVVFSSDNGPEDIHIANANHSGIGSPGPFRGRKRSLYEGGVRVPFIVRWPGRVPAGRIDDASVISATDFLPTMAKLTSTPIPRTWALDGEEVSDILQGNSRGRSKPIFWEWRFRIAGHEINRSPILAIREGQWKLLMNPDRSRVELYDIPRDAMEVSNVAEKNPALVRRLSEKALAWHRTLPPGPIEPEAGNNSWPMPKAH